MAEKRREHSGDDGNGDYAYLMRPGFPRQEADIARLVVSCQHSSGAIAQKGTLGTIGEKVSGP